MKQMISIVALVMAMGLTACQNATPPNDAANSAIQTIVPAGWEDTYNSFHYAPAVKAGDLLILSGVVAGTQDGKTDTQSYTEAFEMLTMILKEGGATWDDVVEIQTFHTDLPAQINTFSTVKDEFIKEPYPAWTAIDIDRLFPYNGLVEIKVTAYLGSN